MARLAALLADAIEAGPAAGADPDDAVHLRAASADRWWRRAALVATVPLNLRSAGGKGDAARTLAVCRGSRRTATT
jgi:hypothetical protein